MSTKRDVYQTVTDRIIAQLEKVGPHDWRMPWARTSNTLRLPTRSNGQAYSGINVFMLWAESIEKGYQRSQWMTFKQAQQLGGCVRKGEKSSPVVFWSTSVTKDTKDKPEDEQRRFGFLKQYAVFNVEQIDGLDASYYPLPAEPSDLVAADRRKHADRWFASISDLVYRDEGERAYYEPVRDFVCMPDLNRFDDVRDYYSTLCHEVTHWTGHKSRLDREDLKLYALNIQNRAREELTAELGAAMLMAQLGLSPAANPRLDHSQYLANWLQVLKEDKKAIFQAAKLAQKASDYLDSVAGLDVSAVRRAELPETAAKVAAA